MSSIDSAKVAKIVRTARLTIASLLSVIAFLAIASFSLGSATAGVIPGQYIVVLKDGVDGKAVASEHARTLGAPIFFRYQHALNGYATRLAPAALAAIQADNRVLFVSEDREMFVGTVCTPQDFSPSVQCIPTGIDRIDGDLSSTKSGNGRGSVNINVAVLDSGIDVDHPDLAVAGGVICSSDKKTFDDLTGHGTHVAGSIGALDNNIGVVGVAPGARLWAVRVCNKNGSCNMSSLLCGIDWATSTRSDSDPSNDISVANMSLGGKGQDDGNCGKTNKDAFHLAICNSVAAGVVYVVSAMNSATDFQDTVPAAYDEVLTATAMTDTDGQPGGLGATKSFCPSVQPFDDTAASFSNFATLPSDQAHTIAAPGVCIFSTFPGGYAISSGTSMASPHVAGTVAVCIASGACGGMTPAQIIQKIVSDAADYNIAHPEYGFVGDPLHPITDKYYGYLIRAGSY